MKQINYFKFLEKFPEFIDIDESDIVKFTLLAMLKKMYWRKKENEKDIRLLPISYANVSKNPEYYREKGLDKFNYIVVFRKYRLFSIQFIDKGGFNSTGKKHVTFPIIHFQMSRNLAYPDTPTSPIHFLSKDELKNWKRTILIDDMLK